MTVYYINLLLILGLAFPLCIHKPQNWKKALYLAVTMGYLWFLATFREGIGFDYNSYIQIFQTIGQTQGLQALLALQWEPGFVLLTKAMTLVIADSVVMYGVYSALILLPIAWFIYRYSQDAWISVWLYVTLAHYYQVMNFIRQSLACGIAVLCYRFLKEKKPVPYFLLVLLAASMHKTALILIPVYFFCHIRLDKRMAIFYASATLLLYMASRPLMDFAMRYVFSYYRGSFYVETGFPMGFLIVPIMLLGAELALYPAWRKRDPHADMLINLQLYSTIVWLFITKHFILERFGQYVYIFTLISIPAALRSLLAAPEQYEKLEALSAEKQSSKKGKSKGKQEQHQILELRTQISDHKKYYWSAVAALIFVTWIYNEFGTHVNNFHGVFPYNSVLDWLA